VSTPDDIAKQHAEELRTLEERLTAKHQAELNAAAEAARTAAGQEKPPAGTVSEDDLKAAIAAAIATHEKELQARHAEDIASAVERGRMEQAAKGKLKDSQLVKAQKKVKELEIQIMEWRKAGILPETSSAPPPATPVAAGALVTNASPTTPAASAPHMNNGSTGTATLPQKPSLGPPTGPAESGRGRGAGRGVRGQRGGLSIRGAAPGRGGAPANPPTVSASGSGVQIAGAAAKRSREEGEAADDSLAKRLKPADGAGKPVALRRPPP
jgi:nucleoprotein TPR